MRKIISFLLCIICTIASAQDVVRKVYPNATISKQHHMSFLGISLGNSVTAFDNALKQKGFKHVGKDYEDEHHFQGNLFGLKDFPLDVCFDAEHNIHMLYSFKKFHNKNYAESYLYRIKNYLSKNYVTSIKSSRSTFYYSKDTYNHYFYDIFSSDKRYHIGNIELLTDEDKELNEYNVEIKIINIPNKYNEYICKIYDISKFIKPTYSMGQVQIYPNFNNLVLINIDGTKEKYCLDLDEHIEKFIKNSNYTYEEKSYLFNQFAQKIKSLNIPQGKSLFNLSCSSADFYNIKHNYDRAKEEYENSPEHMSKGELWFCLWEGSANVEKYKRDGSYKRRVKAFVSRWNNFVDSGSNGNSTNWDNLNDAQKAVIHDHDNGR